MPLVAGPRLAPTAVSSATALRCRRGHTHGLQEEQPSRGV